MEGLSTVVRDVVKALKITNAIFVGSGLGAYVIGHMMAELAPVSSGFLMCDLGTTGSNAAEQSIGSSWWIQPADALQVKINATEQPVGIIDRAASADLVALLNPALLWRNAVQVVPGVTGHVASDQPSAFERLVCSFVQDILAQPLNEFYEPPPLPSEQQKRVSTGPSRQKHAPGTMPNPMGRYEPPAEDDGAESKLNSRISSDAANPNRRGKITPGTMPHPAARYDFVPDEEPEEVVRAFPHLACASVSMLSPPSLQHPAIAAHLERQATHENGRGRVQPGTMPHPGMRFELPVDEVSESHSPEVESQLRRQGSNANARGRVAPGTMPHPGSRFELAPDDDQDDEERSKLARAYSREVMASNPNAKGRIVGGTMPHPSSRFETTTPAGAHLKGGALMHPDLRFHTEPGNIGDMPSTRVQQPPGGYTNNIFG